MVDDKGYWWRLIMIDDDNEWLMMMVDDNGWLQLLNHTIFDENAIVGDNYINQINNHLSQLVTF